MLVLFTTGLKKLYRVLWEPYPEVGMGKSFTRIIKEYSFVIIGALIVGLGIKLFFIENRIAAGGFSGLATVMYHFWGFPVGVTVLIMNIPLILLSVLFLGRGLGIKTIMGMVTVSLSIDLMNFLPTLTQDLLLASLMGGVMVGGGLGVIFRQGATTGGTDLTARLVHKFLPFLSVGKFLMLFDITVVIISTLAFKSYELGLYAGVSIFITTKVMDNVMIGVDYTKAVYIISEHSDLISARILKELDRGVTALQGKGMYTGKDREMLLCVMRPKNIIRMKKIVAEEDPKAFVFISDIRDVMGEGFHPYLD